MKGPSGRVLDSTICHIETGLDVRCGYGPEDLLRSQHAVEIGAAREIVEQWRHAVIAKGGFSELGGDLAVRGRPLGVRVWTSVR